jgi:lipid-binding SYLF domain-containing protein
LGIGGGYGKGNLYVNNKDGSETLAGTSEVIQVSVGFQMGGQLFSEIVFFEDERDMERFTSGPAFEFGADVNVVALESSAGASATTMGAHASLVKKKEDISISKQSAPVYIKGLAVFSIALKGLMYQATLAGQRFTYKAIGESDAKKDADL